MQGLKSWFAGWWSDNKKEVFGAVPIAVVLFTAYFGCIWLATVLWPLTTGGMISFYTPTAFLVGLGLFVLVGVPTLIILNRRYR